MAVASLLRKPWKTPRRNTTIKITRAHRVVLYRTVFENTAYLERDMPYFAFVSTNAVLVRKNDRKVSK